MVKLTAPLQSITAHGTYAGLLQYRRHQNRTIVLAAPTRRAPLPQIIRANAAYTKWLHTWITDHALLTDPDWTALAKEKNVTTMAAIIGHALARWQLFKAPLLKPDNPDQPSTPASPTPLYVTGYPDDRPHLRPSGAATNKLLYFHVTTADDPLPTPRNFVSAVRSPKTTDRFPAQLPAIAGTVYYFTCWTEESATPKTNHSTPLP